MQLLFWTALTKKWIRILKQPGTRRLTGGYGILIPARYDRFRGRKPVLKSPADNAAVRSKFTPTLSWKRRRRTGGTATGVMLRQRLSLRSWTGLSNSYQRVPCDGQSTFTVPDISYYVDFPLPLFIVSSVKLFRSWRLRTGGESLVIGRAAETIQSNPPLRPDSGLALCLMPHETARYGIPFRK